MLTPAQQLFKQLEKANNILITFSSDWPGDAVSGALALFLVCQKIQKNAEIIAAPYNSGTNTDSQKELPWSFLPGFKQISPNLNNLRKFIVSLNIKDAKINQIKYLVENNTLNFIISPSSGWFSPEDISTSSSGFKYDLIIVVGAVDLESLGSIYDQNIEFFYKTTIINIDHQPENEEFGQVNLIDLNAVAATETIFEGLKEKMEIIDEDIATCLLTGIVVKTKNFKTANLTPRTLLNTSRLIAAGARREEIVDKLYRSREFNVLKLWGKVLNNLKAEASGAIVYSLITADDFNQTETNSGHLNEIIEELIVNIPEAKVIALFCELGPETTEVLIHSNRSINAAEILHGISGTKNNRNAQGVINKKLTETCQEYIEQIKKMLDKIALG